MATQRDIDTEWYKALGRLSVMMGDTVSLNCIDNGLTRAEFHAYLTGMESAVSERRAARLAMVVENLNVTINARPSRIRG
jgi:hypothetical protein